MIAVSMAPPAPPAITCEMIPSTLRLPDCAAAVMAGSNSVTTWPSTPPPIKPEIMLPIIPRSKVGDDFPTATPPSAPVTRLIKICSMLDLPAFRLASRLSRNDLAVDRDREREREVRHSVGDLLAERSTFFGCAGERGGCDECSQSRFCGGSGGWIV